MEEREGGSLNPDRVVALAKREKGKDSFGHLCGLAWLCLMLALALALPPDRPHPAAHHMALWLEMPNLPC